MGPKPTKQTIVVSNNRPKITIRQHPESLRVTIPGYSRTTIALAHAIVGEFLGEIVDGQWSLIGTPKIEAGDRLRTCTIITVELLRVESLALASNVVNTKLAFLGYAMRDATVRICKPIGGERTHDIVSEEAV